jgi:hypothetical protein
MVPRSLAEGIGRPDDTPVPPRVGAPGYELRHRLKHIARAPMRNRPKPPPLDEARLQMKLAGARQRVRNLIVLGMNPGVSAETRAAVQKMESWTRAEVKVHSRLLEHFRWRQSRSRGDGQLP